MLYEFITTNRDDILLRARAKVTSRQWPGTTVEEVESGLPLFLTQLAETLRLKFTAEPFPATTMGGSATEHGSDLLARGFTISQVVHDYGDICQAITEAAVEKKLEISSPEFQTLNLCLDNAIASAVTEFSRQREQALSDMEGEAERLGQLTHELRNFLSTAMLSYEALRSGRVAIGGSTGLILGRSLSRLRDLIDTTVSEVRLSAGKCEAKTISVSRFLHEVQGMALLQAEQREMALDFAIPAVDAIVKADPQLLASALFNLIQNAFKYSIPHGRVGVRTVCGDERVTIDVEDECGGLPDENSEAFFSPFGARRGKDRSGLGLGLSISRKAVRTFAGDIRIRNLPGRGCIFTIDLPVATGRARGGRPLQ
jgi:signal transduction histidine kinase